MEEDANFETVSSSTGRNCISMAHEFGVDFLWLDLC